MSFVMLTCTVGLLSGGWGLGWHQYTTSSHATTLESNKSEIGTRQFIVGPTPPTTPPVPSFAPFIPPPRKAATKEPQPGTAQTGYRRSRVASVQPWLAQSATDQTDHGDVGGVAG